jgi:hypothetical protein
MLLAANSLVTEMSRHNSLDPGAKNMIGDATHAVRATDVSVLGARRPVLFIPGPADLSAGQTEPAPVVLSISSGNDSRPEAAALGEAIVFRVLHLEALIQESAKERSPLVIYVDGLPLKGVAPSAVVPEKDEIAYTLLSTGPARDLWDQYLRIRGRDHFFTQDVAVTLGLENRKLIAETAVEAPNFSLVLIRKPVFIFCAFLTLLLFGVFQLVAYRSDLLRDAGANPVTGRRPFSLSRSQMALWFFVVIVSFLLLWVETGRTDTMPLSVIAMLGISAATAISAAVIDSSARRMPAAVPSRNFFIDIISDEQGVCFHRFQMAGWTLVLAVVFFYTVFTELRMPDFDASMLLLMGISSGTYLGYKIPEHFGMAAART